MSHALLGGSNAHIYLKCVGSARKCEGYPDTSSTAADEGSLAHEISEKMLRCRIDPEKWGNIDWDAIHKHPLFGGDEMMKHCLSYVNYVMGTQHDLIFVEEKLDFSQWVPEGFGTGDAILYDDMFSTLHVIDLKYGVGKRVSVGNNEQLQLYALGAYAAFGYLDIERVVVHIYQPRIDNIQDVEYTVEELLAWGEEIKPIAQKAWDGVQEYVSGEHCRFCKAKDDCKVRMDDQIAKVFDDYAEPTELVKLNPSAMTDEDITYWLRYADQVIKFLTKMKEYATNKAVKDGYAWTGFKLVDGTAKRSYSDEAAIRKVLTARKDILISDWQKMTILPIGEMEKLLGKERFQEIISPFIKMKNDKPKLVPDDGTDESIETAFLET